MFEASEGCGLLKPVRSKVFHAGNLAITDEKESNSLSSLPQ